MIQLVGSVLNQNRQGGRLHCKLRRKEVKTSNQSKEKCLNSKKTKSISSDNSTPINSAKRTRSQDTFYVVRQKPRPKPTSLVSRPLVVVCEDVGNEIMAPPPSPYRGIRNSNVRAGKYLLLVKAICEEFIQFFSCSSTVAFLGRCTLPVSLGFQELSRVSKNDSVFKCRCLIFMSFLLVTDFSHKKYWRFSLNSWQNKHTHSINEIPVFLNDYHNNAVMNCIVCLWGLLRLGQHHSVNLHVDRC